MNSTVEPATFRAVRQAAESARAFLLGEVADMWSRRGRLRNGLFPERFNLSGAEDTAHFRTFVQARHIFSFATIGRLGWTGPWQELISGALETLLNRARRPDGLFVHSMNSKAEPLDGRADLYDQAFVLLALGVAGSSLGRPELYDEAERLLTCIEEMWKHPSGGFREGEIVDQSIRRQNPHMHLLEAFLALAEASGRTRFADAAKSVASLARDRFVDKASGALLEYFTDDLRPASGAAGQIVEPGHCFEWGWLFERIGAENSREWLELSEQLARFGRAFGIDRVREVTVNEVLTSGELRDARARLWPQTERLKAAAARFCRLATQEEADELLAACAGLNKYFDVPTLGLWRDKLDEHGNWVEELAPGSSLYHISCAYAELWNVAQSRPSC